MVYFTVSCQQISARLQKTREQCAAAVEVINAEAAVQLSKIQQTEQDSIRAKVQALAREQGLTDLTLLDISSGDNT